MIQRIDSIYEEFQNFPVKHSIVRNNQKNDAYCIYTMETLLFPFHGIKEFSRDNAEHLDVLTQSIVPPPDDYIDIFYEQKELDEKTYHIVQVKNSVLGHNEIEIALKMMEASINNFIKAPKTVNKQLLKIIGDSDFSKDERINCRYYLVHAGDTKTIRNLRKNQTIHNFKELEALRQGIELQSVPEGHITIDTINNFIVNNFLDPSNSESSINRDRPRSLLCNLNGYELAKLNNQYASSLAGRNILYGQNLRESLSKRSKTFDSMFQTINTEPELFLYYNNGITILCSDFNVKSKNNIEKVTLKKFSVINGAQTTSTLGDYLNEAQRTNDEEKIEQLKKVFVLTKIYEISATLEEHEKISENIRIYTNTQTPLSNRDMVSIRREQITLQRKFIDDCDNPNIFMAIKNGERPNNLVKLLPYQIITNERLAQLCFAGPLQDPFTAKDKRSKLFNQEVQEEFTLNQLYHLIFDTSDGYLFRATNIEIDELLFVYKLHEDAKKFYKKKQKEAFMKLTQEATQSETDKRTRDMRLDINKRSTEISAVFIFHNIAAYYLMKKFFDSQILDISKLTFNSKKYYNDLKFKEKVIEAFIDLVYTRAISIIADNSGIGNIQNWTRSRDGADLFLKRMTEEIASKEWKLEDEYRKFIELSKTNVYS
jgi:hypothetical protein